MPTPDDRHAEALEIARDAAELLEVDSVDADDDLLALGADSITILRLLARIAERTGELHSARLVFEHPTPAALAARLETLAGAGLPLAPLPAGPADEAPLTPIQRTMWAYEVLSGGGGTRTNNCLLALRLEGPLDVPALERSWRRILERHAPLRSRFPYRKGGAVALVDPATTPTLVPEDLADRKTGKGALESIAREHARAPYHLEAGPVHRLRLVRRNDRDHVLLVAAHHIATDRWSYGILLEELSALYAEETGGPAASLPELPARYGDVALWEATLDGEPALAAQVERWRERLTPAFPSIELVPVRDAPPWDGDRESFLLSTDEVGRLREVGRGERATLYMTFLAAFAAVLSRVFRLDRLSIGGLVARRRRRELERLVGPLLNPTVLRLDVPGEASLRDLVRRARETTVEALGDQDVSWESLIRALRPPPASAGAPTSTSSSRC
jgi:aryl carrier-like protein